MNYYEMFKRAAEYSKTLERVMDSNHAKELNRVTVLVQAQKDCAEKGRKLNVDENRKLMEYVR